MNKLGLQKIVTLVATLAFGSGCIVNGALARGHGGCPSNVLGVYFRYPVSSPGHMRNVG